MYFTLRTITEDGVQQNQILGEMYSLYTNKENIVFKQYLESTHETTKKIDERFGVNDRPEPSALIETTEKGLMALYPNTKYFIMVDGKTHDKMHYYDKFVEKKYVDDVVKKANDYVHPTKDENTYILNDDWFYDAKRFAIYYINGVMWVSCYSVKNIINNPTFNNFQLRKKLRGNFELCTFQDAFDILKNHIANDDLNSLKLHYNKLVKLWNVIDPDTIKEYKRATNRLDDIKHVYLIQGDLYFKQMDAKSNKCDILWVDGVAYVNAVKYVTHLEYDVKFYERDLKWLNSIKNIL